jgi:hypothetical protein
MTPEEIVTEINRKNRAVLFTRPDYQSLNVEQVLSLMDAAAMRGFQFGSNVALSMVQGALHVQMARVVSANDKPAIGN